MDDEESPDYWTRSKIAKLIELYRTQDCLWNVSSPCYRDKRRRNAAWKTIATTMGYDVMSVERKMKVLKTQFMHCYKLYKKYSINGESYQPKWFAYNSLKFLIPGKIYRENREISRMQEQGLHLIKTESVDITPEEILVQDQEEHTNLTDSHLRQIPSPNLPIPSDSNREESRFLHRKQEESIPKDVPGNIRDEFTIFGELIACRLRKIRDPRTRLTVQFNMSNLLFDAEMQELDGSTNVTNGAVLNGIGKI